MLPIFKSRRIEEQTDMPIKQFTTGKNTFADMKLSAWERSNKLPLTENEVIAPPLVAQITQKTGKNAYVKFEHILIDEQANLIES